MRDDKSLLETVAANLAVIRGNIASAARRVGRKPEDVTLVAVTKTQGVEAVRAAIDCGVRDIGENRVQEAAEKYRVVGPAVAWHFIGHLQKNKVKQALDIFGMVHSVDSYGLAEEISRRAGAMGRVVPVLLQVNVGEEAQKHGVPPREAVYEAQRVASLPHLKLCGLMAIPPYADDPEASRPHFKRLVGLQKEMEALKLENASFNVLSFGMTGDYEVAVEEGATHLRIGTGIFGERKT